MSQRITVQDGKIELVVADGVSDIDIGADGTFAGAINLGTRVAVDETTGGIAIDDASDTYNWTLVANTGGWLAIDAADPLGTEYGIYVKSGGDFGLYDATVAAPSPAPIVTDGAFETHFSLWTTNDVEIAGFGYYGGGVLECRGGLLGADMSIGTYNDSSVFKEIRIDPDAQSVSFNNGLTLFITETNTPNTNVATKGQIWIKDDAPNTLMFTDDANTDFVVGGALSSAAQITVADTASTSTFLVMTDNATGNEAPLTDANLTYSAATTGTLTTGTFSGALSGNATTATLAASATALATGRTIGMTGDVVWTSAAFDGTGNVTGIATIQSDSVTMDMIVDIATDTFLGRVTAATGTVEVLTNTQAKTALDLTGTNSGDQTITLTGDIDGTGTGSFATTIAAKAVDIAMLADGTDGELITWSAAGVATTVAVGTATHVLTSNGVGVAPTFQAPAGGGGTISGTIANDQVAFGAATADSIEGSANLTFDGTNFRFSSAAFGDFVIDRADAAGGSAIAYENNDGVKGYAGFNDLEQFETYTSAAGASGFTVSSTGVVAATSFTGPLTGNADTATTATGATNIDINATTSTDTTVYPVLVGAASTGNQLPFLDSGNLAYNASTNTLTTSNLVAISTVSLTGTNPTLELQDNGDVHFRDEVGTAEGIHLHMPSSVASNPELYFDSTALNPQVHFRDGMWFRIYEGANTDYIEFRHDGTNSWMAHSGTTGNLQLRVNTTESALIATPNAGVGLYHNGLIKFNTVLHTATDQISGAEVHDAEGTMQPVGVGVVINDATTFDTVATHTPFQQANATQTVYFVGAGAGTANFDTYANTGATQTDIPAGTMWYVQNNAATTILVIRGGTSVTIRYWDGSGVAPADADVTVARGGVATVRKVSDTIYDVWGIGLS